jgi:hypothetical protein
MGGSAARSDEQCKDLLAMTKMAAKQLHIDPPINSLNFAMF